MYDTIHVQRNCSARATPRAMQQEQQQQQKVQAQDAGKLQQGGKQ
jgi:hypothetical protein